MNDDLRRSIWWDGSKGSAWFDDVELQKLKRAPCVTGIKHVAELYYSPLRDTYRVRVRGSRIERDMTEAEKLDVEARFGRMSNGANDAWS